MEYGRILLKKEIKGEAIKVFLRALISKSDDKQIRRNLALAVSSPGGLAVLREELQDAKSASALAYLALIFKDSGGSYSLLSLPSLPSLPSPSLSITPSAPSPPPVLIPLLE